MKGIFAFAVLIGSLFHSEMILGQLRPVSVVYDHVMFNYSITRYVPVWEIKSEKNAKKGLLSQHSNFFREVSPNGLEAFKGLIFGKAFVPSEVEDMDAATLESHLESYSFTIHYRVQYRNHSIFLAHLNNSDVRSVIPFRIEGSRWILDPDFAESELYALLSDRNFDPYMGVMGQPVVLFGFEEQPDRYQFFDYSGRGNHGKVRSASIVDGRFGGALKLAGNVAGAATLDNIGIGSSAFQVDFHVNVPKMVYNTEKVRGLLSMTATNGKMVTLELVGNDVRLKYPCATGIAEVKWRYTPDIWSRVSITFNPKGVVVNMDADQAASSTTPSQFDLKGARLVIGAENGVKATMDEFRITR